MVAIADYAAYMDRLVTRACQFTLHDGHPHRFKPDPECRLYCAVCGAEVTGFDHRGQS